MVGGSDGAIHDSLQEAIRIVEAYAKERGLARSQEKSELLLMAGTTVKTPSGIILQVGGKDVPRVRRLRILGLWLQEDGENTYSIGVLRNHAQQVGRLIARIAGKRPHDMLSRYRVSPYWSNFFSAIATVVLGLAISACTGGFKSSAKNIPFTSTAFLRLWQKIKIIRQDEITTVLSVIGDDKFSEEQKPEEEVMLGRKHETGI
ncbi:hypothetical protein ISCGN_014203 [Ixodes scapularis]